MPPLFIFLPPGIAQCANVCIQTGLMLFPLWYQPFPFGSPGYKVSARSFDYTIARKVFLLPLL